MSRTSEVILPVELPRDEAEPGIVGDFLALIKARLSLLVVITTFVGVCMGSEGPIDWLRLIHAVLGSALAAAGAAVLNQVVEANVDRLMERTRYRPLPAGRMRRRTAFALGSALSVVGVGYLWLAVNQISALLAAATVFIYVALYTPLKRKTSLCVTVGAVAGAIPPLIGWTAARPLETGGWILFGVLFTWQMPHFLAIAWMYRDEYAQAGFVMLKRDDPSGSDTAIQSLLYTLALSVISVLPYFLRMNNVVYLIGTVLLDAAMLIFAAQFLVVRERASARRLFFASILFLPLVLGLMVCTKV
jgi:protoheme IX farnesyltransferase